MGRVKYTKAQPGNKFAITMIGLQDPRIRAKFEESSNCLAIYKHTVPTTWIDKGYVVEVKEDA